jgi:hypothetical protein
MCRGSTRISVHYLDFQYNNFLFVFFIVKKWPFYNTAFGKSGRGV